MLCVNVELRERRYPIYIGEGLLKDETCYPLKKGDKVMIVTNPTIAQYYFETVTQTLEKSAVRLNQYYCLMAKNTKRSIL